MVEEIQKIYKGFTKTLINLFNFQPENAMKIRFTGALIQVALAQKGIHLLQELFTKL